MKAKVCMFVYNNCKHDSRVLKEAGTLAENGYDVRVIAILDETTEPYEEREGFKIMRVKKDPVHYKIIRAIKDFQLQTFLKRITKICKQWVSSTIKKLLEAIKKVEEKGSGGYLQEAIEKRRLRFFSVGLVALVFYLYAQKTLYWGLRRPWRVLRARYLRKALYWGLRRPWRAFRSAVYNGLRAFLMLFHKPLSFLDYYRRALSIIAQEPADVYHAHDLNTLPVAWRAKKRFGGKLVYDSHELYTEITGLSALERWLWRKVESLLIQDCESVLTVNESIAKELEKRYNVPRPYVIMNCPKIIRFPVRQGNLIRQALDLDSHEPIILYQGGFAPHRGLENLIEAMHYVSHGILVLLGWGKLEENLRVRAKESCVLGTRVFFLPSVPQDQLLLWTASADIGVIPYQAVSLNNYYTLPNKLFEYIAAGLPVVTSDFPELQKIVEGYGLGSTFNPDDALDIARAIEYVLSDPEHYAFFKRNVQRAAEVFTWQNEEKKLLVIYKKLANMPC